MTDEIIFGTLEDVPLRDAWTHEAHQFTPWLAGNLDRLSEAIGIPLELTDTEVRVGPFSADILARNALDDTVVLIENQLEPSDHTHLGQIMTYLAGLEAHVIVWVAPTFREEHLSAIRWLNEHTVDPFAFFAVRTRVVRISESPLAPLFEVIERPNNWDRQVASVRRDSEAGMSELGQFRLNFWTHFCSLYPDDREPAAISTRWCPLPGSDAVVVQFLAQNRVGVFVRSDHGGEDGKLRDTLLAFVDALEKKLEAPMGQEPHLFGKDKAFDSRDEANWDEMSKWLH